MSLWCPKKWSITYKHTLLEMYLKVQNSFYGVDYNEVATSEISVLGSGDEEIAQMVITKHKYCYKKIIRKLENTSNL